MLSPDIGDLDGLTERDLTGKLNARINQRPNNLGWVEPAILESGRCRTLRRLTGFIPQGIYTLDQPSGGRVAYWKILSRDIEDLQRRIVPLPAQQAEETVDKFYFDKWLYGEDLGVYRPGGWHITIEFSLRPCIQSFGWIRAVRGPASPPDQIHKVT